MLIQKLKNLLQDFNKYYSVKKSFNKNSKIFDEDKKPRLLVLLPDNIGDTIVQLAFLDQLGKDYHLIIHSNGRQGYVSQFLNYPLIEQPLFITRFKPFLEKKYYNFLGRINDQVLVASSFKAKYLIELTKKISSNKKIIYEGEKIHIEDYSNEKLKGFELIFNPFKQNSGTIDSPIFKHLNHFYKSAFDVQIKEENFLSFYSEFITAEDKQKDLVVLIPEATAKYRQIASPDWAKIVESQLKDKQIIILGTDDSIDLNIKHAVDLRGETTIKEAIQYLYSAEEVWAVETGFTHLSYLSGIKTTVLLGGGHFNRFLPWHEHLEHLKIYSQTDKTCFQCNWECEFTQLNDEPAPCLSTSSILNQIINE